MMIESATRQADGSIAAVVDGRPVTVPDDPANRFRQALAGWDAAGNTIASPEIPPPQPVIISYGAFRARWAEGELAALHEARKADWRIDDYVSLAIAQNAVNLSGTEAPQAKALFVALGVLSVERAAMIFTP